MTGVPLLHVRGERLRRADTPNYLFSHMFVALINGYGAPLYVDVLSFTRGAWRRGT
jgi:hypothetical protein